MTASTNRAKDDAPLDARPDAKVQCNVYLPRSVVVAIKHRAIDEGATLSDTVERALRAYLDREESA